MSKDLIDRAEAIAIIENKQKELCPIGKWSRNSVYGSDREKFDAWQEIIDEIDGLPTVQPEVRRGKWIDGVCSACGFDAMYYKGVPAQVYTNFCPNCGADMREADHERL